MVESIIACKQEEDGRVTIKYLDVESGGSMFVTFPRSVLQFAATAKLTGDWTIVPLEGK